MSERDIEKALEIQARRLQDRQVLGMDEDEQLEEPAEQALMLELEQEKERLRIIQGSSDK